jgi:hypothetical protein
LDSDVPDHELVVLQMGARYFEVQFFLEPRVLSFGLTHLGGRGAAGHADPGAATASSSLPPLPLPDGQEPAANK